MGHRKRWLRQPLSWRRGGAVTAVVLAVVAAAALTLDAGGGTDTRPVREYLESRGRPAVEVIERLGRTSQVVLLSDIHQRAEPKRITAAAVRALAEGPGLDAVVLEVSADEQPFIDAFLNAVEEDATALLRRPAAVQERYGVSRAFLEIYHAVFEMNRQVGAARRIRIIAADDPRWPPPDGAAPEAIAEMYAGRAAFMLRRMDDELLSRMPDARVLVLVDGYMALQRTTGLARFAGGDPVEVEWLGSALRDRLGQQARTILFDAGTIPGVQTLPAYHGTRFYRPLRRELDASLGVRVDDTFSVLRDPVLETSSPAMRLDIIPDSYVLRDVADGYIYLRGGL